MILRRYPHLIWPAVISLLLAYLLWPFPLVYAHAAVMPRTDDQLLSDDVPTQSNAGVPGTGGIPPQFDGSLPPDGNAAPTGPFMIGNDASRWEVYGDRSLLQRMQQMYGLQQQGLGSWLMNDLDPTALLSLTGLPAGNRSADAGVNQPGTTSPDAHWRLHYDGNNTQVQVGEIPVALNGGDFLSLNRTVQGVQVNAGMPGGSVTGIFSEVTAPTQTDTFFGAPIGGMLYLTRTPVVPGSEIILLNNRRLARDQDYALDYTRGTLTFNILVGALDRITASYQVVVNGTGGGRLVALQGNYTLNKQFTVGFSHLGLNGDYEAASSERPMTDRFAGSAQPGPFTLNGRPVVAGSDVVLVNGIVQTRGTAYTLDYPTGQLLFAQGSWPAYGAVIEARYHVADANPGSPDRTVTGVNLDWKNGNGFGLNMQMAKSTGGDATLGDTAMSAAGSYTSTRLTASARYRSVSPGFSPLDSSMLAGIERSAEWSAAYSPSNWLTLSTSGDNSHISQNLLGINAGAQGYGLATGDSLQQDRSYSLNLHHPNYPNVAVQHTTRGTNQVNDASVGDQSTSDLVSANWAKNGLSAALNMTRTFNTNQQLRDPFGLTGALTDPYYRFVNFMRNIMLDLGYQRGERFTAGVHVGDTASTSTTDGLATTSGGKNLQANATYKAGNKLTYTATFQANAMDPTQTDGATSSPGQRGWNLTAGTMWQPLHYLDLGVNYTLDHNGSAQYNATSPGSGTPDGTIAPMTPAGTQSTSNGVGVTVNVHPNERLSAGLTANLNRNNAEADGNHSSTTGNNMQANVTYKPGTKLTVTSTLNASTTGAMPITGGGEIPAQRNSTASLGLEWQPLTKLTTSLRYNAGRYAYGDFGQNATSTVSGSAGWQPNAQTSLTGYWALQRMQAPNLSGMSTSQLFRVGAKFTPLRNTTMEAHAQSIRGDSSAGVNQLWQTDGQGDVTSSTAVTMPGLLTVTGTSLTTLGGAFSYHLGDFHDLTLSGEMLRDTGGAGSSYLGIGWHYHATENFLFSLDARRVRYSGITLPGTSNTTELNADLSWRF